ncbi:MAG: hypothetical protein ACRCX2_14845 [Paraclostridium sp.]
MKKLLENYVDFAGELVSKEHEITMEIINKKFKAFDIEIIMMLTSKEGGETTEILTALSGKIETFLDTMEILIKNRTEEIVINNKEKFTHEMARIATEGVSPIEGLKLLQPMFEITDTAFDTHNEVCGEYVTKRVKALMDAVEDKLGIREEIQTIEDLFSSKEVDVEQLLKLIMKIK